LRSAPPARWVPARLAHGNRDQGFTLMELMVVVLIISVLLAIMVPSILGYRLRAADATAQANLRKVLPSVEAYKQDQTTYVGMTPAGLRVTYDSTITAANYTFRSLTQTSYCMHTSSGSRTWRRAGPRAAFAFGACP
jgi:prepilin-type N-terminal cleavage/methylation domain-containing protein